MRLYLFPCNMYYGLSFHSTIHTWKKKRRAQKFYKLLECNRECNKHIQTVTKGLTKIAHIFSFLLTASIKGPVFTDQTHNTFFSWEVFGRDSSTVNKSLIIICVSGINKTIIFIGLYVLHICLHKRIRRSVFWFAEIWILSKSSWCIFL
jgi:hypothetical protein